MSRGPNTSSNGQIQPRAQAQVEKKGGDLAGLLKSMESEIARALPKHVTPERMARVCLTALRTTKNLDRVTPASFLAAIMACAQLGIEPNSPLGQAYLIPYGNNCQLILGYQGMIDLALRSGRVTSIKAYVVREGDHFEMEHGLDEKLVHIPSGDEDAPLTHAYAVARIKDGDPIFTVLSKPAIEKRRKKGASGKGVSSPWDDNYEAMAMKSAVRALWKWLPKSAEMANAQAIDDASERRAPISYAMPEIAETLTAAGLEEPIDVADEAEGEVVS